MQHQGLSADFVVVGAGSSGAVLANRLSADPKNTVVLIEAGPKDSNRYIHIPAGFSKLFRSDVDWDYLTEPQPQLDNRQIYWPRGKTLGGSSSMNAMMWVRGFAADYDEWARLTGDKRWGFAKAVELFGRIEAVEAAHEPDEGTDGPVHVSHQRSPRDLTAAYLAAVQESGFTLERPNQAQPNGFAQTMVTQHQGRRWSAADAYLRPARQRRNLTVLTESLAARITFDGTRATGVEYRHQDTTYTVTANREVVLCGGAINSPQLLMLSGIGDRAELERHGIDVVRHAPEVGANLTDHLVAGIGYGVQQDSLYAAEKPRELVNYLLRHRGMLTSNVGEAYGFARSNPDLALPDLEMVFAPAPFFYEGLVDPTEHAVILATVLLQPHSRGQITLASPDPTAKPLINPRYLSDVEGADRAAIMAGLRLSATFATAPSLQKVLGRVVYPPTSPDPADENTFEQALNGFAHTLYHPTGTCRMGSDSTSVVTPDLEVRGIQGLRVADASVMPSIIRGHTHAPSLLIGEHAAELMSQVVPLAGVC